MENQELHCDIVSINDGRTASRAGVKLTDEPKLVRWGTSIQSELNEDPDTVVKLILQKSQVRLDLKMMEEPVNEHNDINLMQWMNQDVS